MNTAKPFENKVALITGSTRGIGRAIAKMLLLEGAAVVICGRDQEAVSRCVAELAAEAPGKVKGKVADVKDYEQVRALFEFVDREFSGLDFLVNNAGVGRFAKTSEISIDDWHATLDTNLTGVFYCSREALFRFGNQAAATSSILVAWQERMLSRVERLTMRRNLDSMASARHLC